jgi:hypothetical protein
MTKAIAAMAIAQSQCRLAGRPSAGDWARGTPMAPSIPDDGCDETRQLGAVMKLSYLVSVTMAL